MTRASIARQTTNATAANAALEIIAGANKPTRIARIEVYLAAATASVYGLGRPAAKGITPTSPVTALSEINGSDLSTNLQTKTALAWGTGPTVPGQFFRRIDFPASIGASVIWDFMAGMSNNAPTGLWIPAGATLVLWNIGTNGIVDVNVILDEPS